MLGRSAPTSLLNSHTHTLDLQSLLTFLLSITFVSLLSGHL